MSNKVRRFGLRSRQKLKLRSQKVCRECKRNFFPSSYSEYDSDIEDDEICIDCNAKQKAVKQSEPPLSSIAQQSSKTSIPPISRQSHIFPAFKFVIPTTFSQKTPKTSNNTAQSSSKIENDIEPALSNVQTKGEFKGTIKFERATKIRTTSRSIDLSSVSPEPTEEKNDDAVTNRAAISFKSLPSFDPIDDFIAPLPINNNNNRTKGTRKRKKPQKNIPTNTNNNSSLEPITNADAQLKKSVTNIQLDEPICSTLTGKINKKTASASIEPPVATRVSTRIRKKLVPFGLKWSPASMSRSNEHQKPILPAKIPKIQRTSTKTQPNEENTDSEIQPVPIDQIRTESGNSTTNKFDILDMIVIHSRVHSSKEKEITNSETLSVRPMDIKQEPTVEEINSIDLDIEQNDSIDTLRAKFPNVSQFELEYLLFLSKGKKLSMNH